MTGNRGLVIGLALGTPLLLLGVKDVFDQAARTHPFELTRWVVGAALVLDLLVLPACLLLGRTITPRPALRWALSAIATIVVVGWPSARGYGRAAGNPSLLPRNYGMGIAVACVVVVAAASAWLAIRGRRAS